MAQQKSGGIGSGVVAPVVSTALQVCGPLLGSVVDMGIDAIADGCDVEGLKGLGIGKTVGGMAAQGGPVLGNMAGGGVDMLVNTGTQAMSSMGDSMSQQGEGGPGGKAPGSTTQAKKEEGSFDISNLLGSLTSGISGGGTSTSAKDAGNTGMFAGIGKMFGKQ